MGCTAYWCLTKDCNGYFPSPKPKECELCGGEEFGAEFDEWQDHDD